MKKRNKIFIGVAVAALAATLTVTSSVAYMATYESYSGKITTNYLMGNVGGVTVEEDDYLEPGDVRPFALETSCTGTDSYERVILTYYDATTNEVITDADRIALIDQALRYDPTYEIGSSALGTNIVEDTQYAIADVSAYGFNEDFVLDTERSTDSVRYYNYNDVFEADATNTLFSAVVIPKDWTNADCILMGSVKVEIVEQLIQARGFDSAEDAFDALDAELDD